MPPVRLILPICLFLSGLCALAYQVAWARYLAMFLGATAPAYAIVLSTFMGGLAGGAWLFGRRADRTDRPLRLYGRLELIVAALCFSFPWVIDVLGSVYLTAAAPFADAPLPRHVLRFGLAVLALAPPSILMGGTLPAATRFYVRTLDQVGEGVGRLYFINALGAVVGALLAGFLLVPALGLHGTFWLAALLNGGIGLWALRVSTKIDGASACPAVGWEAALEDTEPPPRVSTFPAWVALTALVATAASGAASMIYEVAWIRLLTLVLGGSTYAFTVMVAAFILGIAIGAWLVSWWRPLSKGGLAAFGWLEVTVAFVVLAMVPIYNRLSYFYLEAAAKVPREDGNYGLFLLLGFAICFAVMMVPTILLGATFPLAARLSTRSIDTLGGGVGRAYAFDTGGTILGTIAAGHILFPAVGMHGTFVFAAALNIVAGVGCLLGAARQRMRSDGPGAPAAPRLLGLASVGGIAALLGAFTLLAVQGPRIDRPVLARGMFRSSAAGFQDYTEFRTWLTGSTDMLFYQDGPEGTVAVLEVLGHRVLQVNGKPEASSEGDMPTQVCITHLPMTLHPDPKRAILIGLGGGATAGALLTHTGVRSTVVELSPQVVAANRHFAPYNRGVVDDPRLDLVVEDAKAYLGLTRERFDIIISQPSNPWVAGNANLFTREFFALQRSRLAEGGLMVQWFHDYEMTDDAVRTILNTFATVFPNVRLFHCGAGRDYVLIGSEEPLKPDPARIRAVLAENEEARRDMEGQLGIRSEVGILARNVLDDAGIRALAEGGRIHTDHRPVLDFQAPRGVFLGAMSDLILDADQRWKPADETDLLLRKIDTDDAWFQEVADAMMYPYDQLNRSILYQWVEATGNVVARRRLAKKLSWVGMDVEARDLLREIDDAGLSRPEDRIELFGLEALLAYQARKAQSIDTALGKMVAEAEASGHAVDFDLVAEMAEVVERAEVAAAAWAQAVARTPDDAPWLLLERLVGLSRTRRLAGDTAGAWDALDRAHALRADSWSVHLERERLGPRPVAALALDP
jgi:spermidine synthase